VRGPVGFPRGIFYEVQVCILCIAVKNALAEAPSNSLHPVRREGVLSKEEKNMTKTMEDGRDKVFLLA
jgi:hypothetical protein